MINQIIEEIQNRITNTNAQINHLLSKGYTGAHFEYLVNKGIMLEELLSILNTVTAADTTFTITIPEEDN